MKIAGCKQDSIAKAAMKKYEDIKSNVVTPGVLESGGA
jgi:hypothetical protein